MQSLTTWQSAPGHSVLEEHTLHVWRIALDKLNTETSLAVLDNNEQARAARFTAERPKRNFVMMRTALRNILSRYIDKAPEDFIIEFNEHGKPALSDGACSFNLAHSGEIGLVAISKSGGIGIDIEYVNNARTTGDIAERFFSATENKALAFCSDEEKVRAFFRCWSRKESVIKALGEGLSCPLSSFDVSLDMNDAQLVAFRRDGIEPAEWSMLHISAHTDYEAAAAIDAPLNNVLGFEFNEN